jgi:helicase
MTQSGRELRTRNGLVRLPAYVPVTTFGGKYPLDDLVRPYLPRLADAMMVSFHYARQMKEEPRLPLLVDSGGFASLLSDTRIGVEGGLGILDVPADEATERIHPRDVLELQERIADVAFTLDFPVPPGMDEKEARRRQELTIANAHWALANRRRRDLLLFACVQAWDAESARDCARAYSRAAFDGVAIGGLIPRARDRQLVFAIIEAVREELGDQPLHVFGLGKPEIVAELFEARIDSVDSSSYVQLAADGRLWGRSDFRIDDPSVTDRLHLALCNLATATGCAIPLSAFRRFTTRELKARGVREPSAPVQLQSTVLEYAG